MLPSSEQQSPKSSRAGSRQRSKRLDMVLDIPLASINREDRRFQFRIGASTTEVEESIRTLGQQVPITLWGREPYVIVDGFRRFEALASLGCSSVRAILRDDLDEHGAYRLSFVENVKRRSWTPLEKALAVRVAVTDRGLSVNQIAAELALSLRQVHRYLEITNFDPRLTEALRAGSITMAHAAVLHRAGPQSIDELLPDARLLSVSALKKKVRSNRRGRPRVYLSASDSGFRMSAFQFAHSIPDREKKRVLAALEQALETVRSSLSMGSGGL